MAEHGVNAEPMVNLKDLARAFAALCPRCEKAMRESLLNRIAEKRCADPRPLAILRRQIADAFGISQEDLTGPRKSRYCVSARMAFSKKAHDQGFSLNEIGRALGRHHTTILNLLRQKAA